MRAASFVACVLAALIVPADAQQQPPAAVPVGVVKAERKPIADALDFVGRVDALNRVELRARVTGFLEDVLFKEGDPVKEGAPLYRIEKGLFQAAVDQAEGALERSKASKPKITLSTALTMGWNAMCRQPRARSKWNSPAAIFLS